MWCQRITDGNLRHQTMTGQACKMWLGGNEEDKMKRILPVLFLTAAATMFLGDQMSFAQSQSVDIAPGPIAELLPDFDTPAKGGFGNLNSDLPPNRLPTPNRQSLPTSANRNQLPEANALPPATSQGSSARNSLFDSPAQPRSAGARIDSPPPTMPSPTVLPPSAPGSFYPGSTPVEADRFDTHQGSVNSAVPFTGTSFEDQSCGCESEVIAFGEDCGCESEVIVSGEDCGCDTCDSGDEVFLVDEAGFGNYDDCALEGACPSEGEYYDTAAPQFDSEAKQHSNRRREHKGIFGRHHAKHLAKKQARARRNHDDERYALEDEYASHGDVPCEDGSCGVADEIGAGSAVSLDGVQGTGSFVNTTIGVSGLYFERDYEDDQQFSASRFANERGLFSNDADDGNFSGYDVYLNRRKANGNGFEARFFELEPSRATASLSGGPVTLLSGNNRPFGSPLFLSGVGVQTGGGLLIGADEIFNLAEVHQVTRETSIQNVEFNLLRLGRAGQRKRGVGRLASHEYLVGFRYFRFDESFNYSAQGFSDGNIASGLLRADYLNEVTNSLYGIQIGGRTEIGFLRRFSLIVSTKAGIFNNDFTNNQTVNSTPRGAGTVNAQLLAGQPFDTEGEDSEITMIGELDLGVTYQMFRNSRLRVGYRALFVSDVAFAVPQTEPLFTNLDAVQSPTDNDNLFLQGGYFGVEFAF